MAKSEVEEITRKTIEKGGILAKVYFDMHSEKEEELQPLMTDLISNRVLKFPGVVYCTGEIDVPIKDDKTYSTNAIVTILVKDLWTLLNLTLNFAPAGIEVIKPDKGYYLKQNELQAIMINTAQISAQFSEYVLSKVLSKEDFEKVKQDLSRREELGRKMMGPKENAE